MTMVGQRRKKRTRTRAENLRLIAECKRLVRELRAERPNLPNGI